MGLFLSENMNAEQNSGEQIDQHGLQSPGQREKPMDADGAPILNAGLLPVHPEAEPDLLGKHVFRTDQTYLFDSSSFALGLRCGCFLKQKREAKVPEIP